MDSENEEMNKTWPLLLECAAASLSKGSSWSVYETYVFWNIFQEKVPTKWIWLRTTWSGSWKAKQEATVSEYPWEAVGSGRKILMEMRNEDDVKDTRQRPRHPSGSHHPKFFSRCLASCRPVKRLHKEPGMSRPNLTGRWLNKCLDYYIYLRGCKCTKISNE